MPTTDLSSKLIQVMNISPQVMRDQLYTFFSFLGRINEMKLYPSDTNPFLHSFERKVCFVKFEDLSAAETAQHLTNTVLIDRALVIVPSPDEVIPDEEAALKLPVPAMPGQRSLPSTVINEIFSGEGQQMIITIDPELEGRGLPSYPPLPTNTEASKLEEIRRTVYVANIPKDVSPEEIVDFFSEKVAEVMYVRMAGDDEDMPCNFAYVEFSHQKAVVDALQANGIAMGHHSLHIQHATEAIVKPQIKTAEAALKEVEDAAEKKVAEEKERAAGNSMGNSRSASMRRSRSRSPRSRSGRLDRPRPFAERFNGSDRDYYRSRRSRSRGRDYDRDYRRSHHRRSRNLGPRNAPSQSHVDGSRHRRSRSRSKDRKRDRDRDRKSSKDRDRKSSKDRDRKSSKDRDRKSSKDRDLKSSKDKDRKSSKDRSDREKSRRSQSKETSKKSRRRSKSSSRSRKVDSEEKVVKSEKEEEAPASSCDERETNKSKKREKRKKKERSRSKSRKRSKRSRSGSRNGSKKKKSRRAKRDSSADRASESSLDRSGGKKKTSIKKEVGSDDSDQSEYGKLEISEKSYPSAAAKLETSDIESNDD